jgi:hypothetical protein
MLYGHGLLGSASELLGIGRVAAAVNIASCATDWIGMSSGDIGNVVTVLSDLSTFRTQADRLQQGHLNFLFLGRLMRHAAGLGSHPAFQKDGASVLDGREVFLLGASQGGILGGATSAVAQDWTRAVLAVGAANYSLLIPRSVDFDEFEPVLAESYPDALTRRLGFGLAQMLWDRGEANAYLQHLTRDPYPGTPVKDILHFMAFSDHQVANVATEVAARVSLRAGARCSPFGDQPCHRTRGPARPFGISGNLPPPIKPPRDGEGPHASLGRRRRAILVSSTGALVDVRNGAPRATVD